MDPISLIPKVLSCIQKLYGIIREVKVNKKKCQQLRERIETIRETLKPLQETTLISENIQNALNHFCEFIDECTNFVKNFIDVRLYKRVYARRSYNDEFVRYDRELSNYNNYLQLNIQIAMGNNLNKITGTINETRNAIDEYTLDLARRIDIVAQSQSTTTENLTTLSNRMDMVTKTINELHGDVSNLVQIMNSYGLKLNQNIEGQQQMLTQIAERNKKHSGIFRKSFRRVKQMFKN
jgi:uncharacterized protein YoxC